jgi:F-type H+-transporting ATPase subunit delta
MRSSRVAGRYAQAFLETAEAAGNQESLLKDAAVLRETVAKSRDFRSFLKSPVIKGETKESVLKVLFGTTLHPATMKFLLLLVEKKREDILAEILDELFRLHDERAGIVTLHLQAATVLSDSQRSTIAARFERITGKKVRLVFVVDGALKGGVLARVGDTVYDGTVKRQLEMLREQFARTMVSN